METLTMIKMKKARAFPTNTQILQRLPDELFFSSRATSAHLWASREYSSETEAGERVPPWLCDSPRDLTDTRFMVFVGWGEPGSEVIAPDGDLYGCAYGLRGLPLYLDFLEAYTRALSEGGTTTRELKNRLPEFDEHLMDHPWSIKFWGWYRSDVAQVRLIRSELGIYDIHNLAKGIRWKIC